MVQHEVAFPGGPGFDAIFQQVPEGGRPHHVGAQFSGFRVLPRELGVLHRIRFLVSLELAGHVEEGEQEDEDQVQEDSRTTQADADFDVVHQVLDAGFKGFGGHGWSIGG